MRAREVKCPTCGEGLVDVAPDYPVSLKAFAEDFPDADAWGRRENRITARCRNRHLLGINAFADNAGAHVTVEDLTRPQDWVSP